MGILSTHIRYNNYHDKDIKVVETQCASRRLAFFALYQRLRNLLMFWRAGSRSPLCIKGKMAEIDQFCGIFRAGEKVGCCNDGPEPISFFFLDKCFFFLLLLSLSPQPQHLRFVDMTRTNLSVRWELCCI